MAHSCHAQLGSLDRMRPRWRLPLSVDTGNRELMLPGIALYRPLWSSYGLFPWCICQFLVLPFTWNASSTSFWNQTSIWWWILVLCVCNGLLRLILQLRFSKEDAQEGGWQTIREKPNSVCVFVVRHRLAVWLFILLGRNSTGTLLNLLIQWPEGGSIHFWDSTKRKCAISERKREKR